MVAPAAQAADDVFEKMNSHARTLDQRLTILVSKVDECTQYPDRTKVDLEGMLFVVRDARMTMECQYVLTDKCDKAKTLKLAKLQLNDLVHKKLSKNSDVYNLTKNAFAARKCTEQIKALDEVATQANLFLVEFNKLDKKRPPAPGFPKQEED